MTTIPIEMNIHFQILAIIFRYAKTNKNANVNISSTLENNSTDRVTQEHQNKGS